VVNLASSRVIVFGIRHVDLDLAGRRMSAREAACGSSVSASSRAEVLMTDAGTISRSKPHSQVSRSSTMLASSVRRAPAVNRAIHPEVLARTRLLVVGHG
jgi:hypothetical protein